VTASAERGERLAALGAAAVVHDIGASTGPFDLVLESTAASAATPSSRFRKERLS